MQFITQFIEAFESRKLLHGGVDYDDSHNVAEPPPVVVDQPVTEESNSFRADLTGTEEAPPRTTPATGVATFELSADGNSLTFRIEVSNIQNVVAAHLHVGGVGLNGEIVVNLFGPEIPGGGPVNGLLAEGTITEANLIGSLAGSPLSALITPMRGNDIYVNVHTNDGVDPTNTGPGDFPGGEIRGQVRVVTTTTSPDNTTPPDDKTPTDDDSSKHKKKHKHSHKRGKKLGHLKKKLKKHKGKGHLKKQHAEWWKDHVKDREDNRGGDDDRDERESEKEHEDD